MDGFWPIREAMPSLNSCIKTFGGPKASRRGGMIYEDL